MTTIAFAGQSLASQMFQDFGVGPTPLAGTYLWNISTQAWGPVTGGGAITYANCIKQTTGQDVYLYNLAQGGSALLAQSATPASFYWLNTDPGPATLMDNFFAQITAGGKVPDLIEWNQGQADFDTADPNIATHYGAGLDILYGRMCSGLGVAAVPFTLWVPHGGGGPVQNGSTGVLQAGIAWATSRPGAMLGPWCGDLQRTDDTHLTGYGYVYAGYRGAIGALHRFGAPGFSQGCGPQIIGARQVGSTVILDLKFYGGTFLRPTNNFGNVDLISGFELWNSDFSSIITGFDTRILGDKIRIDLPAAIQVNVSYQRQSNFDCSLPAFDNNDPFNIGMGFPMTPLPSAILAVT